MNPNKVHMFDNALTAPYGDRGSILNFCMTQLYRDAIREKHMTTFEVSSSSIREYFIPRNHEYGGPTPRALGDICKEMNLNYVEVVDYLIRKLLADENDIQFYTLVEDN